MTAAYKAAFMPSPKKRREEKKKKKKLTFLHFQFPHLPRELVQTAERQPPILQVPMNSEASCFADKRKRTNQNLRKPV